MGKSGKLFKSLVAGVKVFKSPPKEKPATEALSTPHANKKEDKDHVKKKSKDKCFGSLGKSSSRNRDVAATASFPDAIEIKCVQVESEKLKDMLPVAESLSTESSVGNKGLKVQAQGATNNASLCNQLSSEFNTVSDQEAWAASKIQAAFRCYLAQRAFRALKALVRVQALVRGRTVRRQASTSLQCLTAVIRIQALARGHRVRNSELGQLVQKHLQQAKQSRKKPAEGWVNSLATAQQLHAKAQSKQDAVTKRQRALVYAFSEQLNRRTQKQSTSSGLDDHLDKSHWIWVWLERWTEATVNRGVIATAVEEHTPVTKTIEKPKSTTKAGKPSDSSKKEGRKLNEHVDGSGPPSQKGLFVEEKEKVVYKKEEKVKAMTDSEKPSTRKPSGSGNNSSAVSATTVMPKPVLSAPLLATPPLSSVKENSFLATKEINLPAMQVPSSSAVSAVMKSTSPVCAYEATPSSPSDTSLQPPTCDVKFAGVGITASPGVNSTSASFTTHKVLSLNSPSSPTGSAKQPSCDTTEMLPTGSESPARKSTSNSLSTFSFSPPEACSPAESLPLTYPLKERCMPAVSAAHPHNEQDMFSIDHASLPPPSGTPDLTQQSLSNGMLMPADDMHVVSRDNGMHVTEDIINVHSVVQDNEVHVLEETINYANGDCGMHMPGDGVNGDALKVFSEESASPTNEDMDCKNDDFIQIDALSETTGRCDASIVSVSAKSVDISSKHTTGPGLKHEQHGECVSPSVPSYMATTKSSMAKIRTLTSPKPKTESPKQKQDSPKPKADSPTQKPDSATKRRHSLSALDGKVSPVTQKSSMHVRANSKGQLSSSLKDLSIDNLSLSNGNSRRHGK